MKTGETQRLTAFATQVLLREGLEDLDDIAQRMHAAEAELSERARALASLDGIVARLADAEARLVRAAADAEADHAAKAREPTAVGSLEPERENDAAPPPTAVLPPAPAPAPDDLELEQNDLGRDAAALAPQHSTRRVAKIRQSFESRQDVLVSVEAHSPKRTLRLRSDEASFQFDDDEDKAFTYALSDATSDVLPLGHPASPDRGLVIQSIPTHQLPSHRLEPADLDAPWRNPEAIRSVDISVTPAVEDETDPFDYGC